MQDTSVAVNGIVSIPVEEIHPFYDHPFRLYEGDRLEDMVQSIRAYGVLNPVIVRKAARGYEMLAGHNRTNAAKIAGLTEVPAIVKTDLSDEDTMSTSSDREPVDMMSTSHRKAVMDLVRNME